MPHYEELFAQFHEQPAPSATVAWGDITGTLADQVDLQAALDSKLEAVDWGMIGGDILDQVDLQAALALKLDASAYTAADVLAKLLTVDGAGSGLDADLLDGQSSAFYRDPANLSAAVPISLGGTGSTTALTARAALGLAIGTDVQAQDAELQAIAGLVSANNRLPYFTGSGTAALAVFPASGRAIINTAGTANTFPYFSAANTVTLASITTAGLAILDDADAAAQRATLALGTMATETAANYALLAGAAFTGAVTIATTLGVTGLTRLPSAVNSSSAALQSYFTTGAATPNWQVVGSSAAESFIGISRFVASTGGPALFLGHSRGAAPGTQTALSANDVMGLVSFFGSDGTQFREGARISAEVDATTGTADMPGRMLFMVSPDGAAAPAEALRLSQDLAALFAGTVTATGALAALSTLNVTGDSTLSANLVVGANMAIPSNTKAYIDRLSGGSALPALSSGTVLTLAGSSAASSPAHLQLISGNTAATSMRFGDTDAAFRGAVSYDHNTDALSLVAAGSTAISIDSSLVVTLASVLTGTNIYNTYTPTLTSITNVASSSANLSGWIRIGNAVLVFAQISVTATAAAALTVIDVSLPVASNLSAATQAVGAGSILTAGTEVAGVAISGNATNDRARATFVSSSTSARTYTLMFGYIVI
jgi:hypothetical protein